MGDVDSVSNLTLQQKQAEVKAERAEAKQVSASESFTESCEESSNPWAADKDKEEKFKHLGDRQNDVKALAKMIKAAGAAGAVDDAALRFQQKNPELNAKSLVRLLQSLKDGDTQDEVLQKLLKFFPDKSIADEAFDFLLENSSGNLHETLKEAKEGFNKQYGREIVAGKNIATQAREFSKQGLGTTDNLRDLYRDITGNPRQPSALFTELSQSYNFQQLKSVVQFLLHAMGSDLRSKGPSIDRGELSRLFTETRSLQAILGVYRFFQSRMGLVNQLFTENQLVIPKTLTFETLAQLFIKMVEDRYPAAAKALSMAGQMGISGQKAALIIVLSQWRDAVRNVAPKLFKDIKARDELFSAIIKALSELEEEDEENGPV